MTALDNLPGTTLAGCMILSKIGQGGMGTVYTAHHIALDKTVCVKILSPDLARDGRNIELFMREAHSAATLEHPNIVRIYSFGQENDLHYIVMSYIEGRSLAEIVAKNGPMDTETATGIMIEVLDALRHAHSKAIVHRDIKPSNILLGSNGHSSLVDFGLARSVSEEKLLTVAGEIIGTAYFMSPEQGLAGQVDHRADLYSAGATFFYLLTGRYPFEGKSYIEVVHKHIGEPLPNIIVLKPDVPLWVSRVLDQLMRKDPKDRYQSAAQAIDEIKRLKAGTETRGDVSIERSIELPGLTERLTREGASPAAPVIRQVSAISPHPESPAAAPPGDSELPYSGLRKTVKTALYCAVTAAAVCCFLLAGSAVTKESGVLPPFRSLYSANPASGAFLSAAGAGLVLWAMFFKPLQSSAARFFLLAASCLTAYAGALYLPYPYNPDMSLKAFLYLQVAAENVSSPSNLLLCSLFMFIAGSMLFSKRNRTAKVYSAAAYLVSLLLIYICFRGEAQTFPKESRLALAAIAALAGTTAALTKKRLIFFFSAPVLFFTANALMIAALTAPEISAIAEKSQRAQTLYQENGYKRQSAAMNPEQAAAKTDQDGRTVKLEGASTQQDLRPATPGARHLSASLEYYKMLAYGLKHDLLNTAGLAYASLFLLFMDCLLFAEAVICHQ